MTNYKIINKNGHYEAYVNGKFYCSADTVIEAARELESMVEE